MTPKEKSAESKLITAREKTPARLTTDMLRGQALKSLEHTDSLKLQQGNEDNHKLEDWSQSNSLCVPAPAKEERKEVNGSEKLDLHLFLILLRLIMGLYLAGFPGVGG